MQKVIIRTVSGKEYPCELKARMNDLQQIVDEVCNDEFFIYVKPDGKETVIQKLNVESIELL